MKIPGGKLALQQARWLRSRFVSRVLILGYHRIADVSWDPFAMCVSPQRFVEQLEVLHHIGDVISLSQLAESLRQRKLPRQGIVLTFDDGYADTLYHAKPTLAHFHMPATVFVTTHYLGRAFWWDELAEMFASPTPLPDRLSLSIGGRTYLWQTGKLPRRRLLWSLYQTLLTLSPLEQQQAIEQLREQNPGPSPLSPTARGLTPGEMIELVSDGWIEAGAHTVTHPLLAKLPAAAQSKEIQQSKAYLEELLGRRVTNFSYPNGSASCDTLALVREAGFVCACGSFGDVARRGSNLLHLPRFWIPDWNGETFLRWLKHWH